MIRILILTLALMIGHYATKGISNLAHDNFERNHMEVMR